jgi:3-oxoacyl-[acyl-carrier protein] reductase
VSVSLAGKRALVTGAGSTDGIGFAAARTLLERGASVLISSTTERIHERAKELGATGFVADLTDWEQARGLADAAGAVDVLVNNAGILSNNKVAETSPEEWHKVLAINLDGAFYLSKLLLPGMKARRWGRIVNILNIGAKAPQATSAPTSVTRAAGMALTKVLSAEGAPHNVLVNALLVGRIQSNQWVKRHATEGKGRSLEAYYAEMGKSIPMGRLGTADEFANMALFLASDAGSYITGTAINIDGGSSPVV